MTESNINENIVHQFKRPTEAEIQSNKDNWYEAYDDIQLTALNLKVAIEVAYQMQGDDKDFDCWIMDKLRDEVIALNKCIKETTNTSIPLTRA